MHHRSRRMLQATVLFGVLLVSGCLWHGSDPDWKALYEQKLGQPIVEMNETALNSSFQDATGHQTRMTWAELEDGSFVLLGLPPYGLAAEDVVAQTAALSDQEARRRCEEAVGKPFLVWGGGRSTDRVGNTFTFDILPTIDSPVAPATRSEGEGAWCRFTFLPTGWELHIIAYSESASPG